MYFITSKTRIPIFSSKTAHSPLFAAFSGTTLSNIKSENAHFGAGGWGISGEYLHIVVYIQMS